MIKTRMRPNDGIMPAFYVIANRWLLISLLCFCRNVLTLADFLLLLSSAPHHDQNRQFRHGVPWISNALCDAHVHFVHIRIAYHISAHHVPTDFLLERTEYANNRAGTNADKIQTITNTSLNLDVVICRLSVPICASLAHALIHVYVIRAHDASIDFWLWLPCVTTNTNMRLFLFWFHTSIYAMDHLKVHLLDFKLALTQNIFFAATIF